MNLRGLAFIPLVLALCACATAPKPDLHPDEPVWSVRRTIVRPGTNDRTLNRHPTAPSSPTVQLRPGMFAIDYPLPEDITPLRPGEIEIYAINTRERVRVVLFTPQGQLRQDAATELTWLMRDHRKEIQHPMEPRLLTMLYMVAQAYQRPLVLISGYRHPKRRKARQSRHASAAAADIRIPGVPSEEVSILVKSVFEEVGVGYYPTSDFVHLDTRRASYYWIDDSGPGEAKREAALDLDPVPPKGTDWTLWAEQLPQAWHY